jgi:hypothetical protein
MNQSFSQELIAAILQRLHHSNTEFSGVYAGDSPSRQPVHTVYGGAQIFKADAAKKLGTMALSTLREYASNPADFAKALGLKGKTSEHRLLYNRIVEKLETEPVEDFRIDFEDGYGNRPDDEEDYHAEFCAHEIVRGMQENSLPPFIGIRLKPFTEDLKARSIRTLDIFLSALLHSSGGTLPKNFVVTLPKVTMPDHVASLADLFDHVESNHHLSHNPLKLEIMIETPQSIINNRGECAVPSLVAAGRGRCISAHFGVYDYTALLNITAAHQTMDHPACDFARSMMKVSLAGTGVWISDGATNVLPVGPHRVAKNGKPLTAKQKKENRETVYRAWRMAFEHTMRSLRNGYYQGWDLHPAQLPIRYAAVFSFFRDGLEVMSNRLKTFVEKAAQATLIGDVMDDAATGQGLLNFFLRGINCGAITEEETLETGLALEEIRTRSFMRILKMRKRVGY